MSDQVTVVISDEYILACIYDFIFNQCCKVGQIIVSLNGTDEVSVIIKYGCYECTNPLTRSLADILIRYTECLGIATGSEILSGRNVYQITAGSGYLHTVSTGNNHAIAVSESGIGSRKPCCTLFGSNSTCKSVSDNRRSSHGLDHSTILFDDRTEIMLHQVNLSHIHVIHILNGLFVG